MIDALEALAAARSQQDGAGEAAALKMVSVTCLAAGLEHDANRLEVMAIGVVPGTPKPPFFRVEPDDLDRVFIDRAMGLEQAGSIEELGDAETIVDDRKPEFAVTTTGRDANLRFERRVGGLPGRQRIASIANQIRENVLQLIGIRADGCQRRIDLDTD